MNMLEEEILLYSRTGFELWAHEAKVLLEDTIG
jgi:hypothetical protein